MSVGGNLSLHTINNGSGHCKFKTRLNHFRISSWSLLRNSMEDQLWNIVVLKYGTILWWMLYSPETREINGGILVYSHGKYNIL